MKTTDIMGHKVHWQSVIWGKFYLWAYDVEGTLYMMKVNEDGTLDIL